MKVWHFAQYRILYLDFTFLYSISFMMTMIWRHQIYDEIFDTWIREKTFYHYVWTKWVIERFWTMDLEMTKPVVNAYHTWDMAWWWGVLVAISCETHLWSNSYFNVVQGIYISQYYLYAFKIVRVLSRDDEFETKFKTEHLWNTICDWYVWWSRTDTKSLRFYFFLIAT